MKVPKKKENRLSRIKQGNHRKKQLKAFERLLVIMDELREKCPWDKTQTMHSLRMKTIEEVYELSEAVLNKKTNEIKEELGDIMLHIVFYAKIASETNDFDIATIINGICDKLVKRHPHVYGNIKAETKEVVKQNWEKLKLMEGKKSILSGIPLFMPAMLKALRIQEKVGAAGFDWATKQLVWEKIEEELNEFKAEFNDLDAEQIDKVKVQEEFGDLLFSLINYARFLNINPEDALQRTNKKFIKRFHYIEVEIKKDRKTIDEMNIDQLDEYWERAKKQDH